VATPALPPCGNAVRQRRSDRGLCSSSLRRPGRSRPQPGAGP
jgi:hypothetical protein